MQTIPVNSIPRCSGTSIGDASPWYATSLPGVVLPKAVVRGRAWLPRDPDADYRVLPAAGRGWTVLHPAASMAPARAAITTVKSTRDLLVPG